MDKFLNRLKLFRKMPKNKIIATPIKEAIVKACLNGRKPIDVAKDFNVSRQSASRLLKVSIDLNFSLYIPNVSFKKIKSILVECLNRGVLGKHLKGKKERLYD